MTQTNKWFAASLGLFFVYITMRGQLGAWANLFVPSASSSANQVTSGGVLNTSGGSSSNSGGGTNSGGTVQSVISTAADAAAVFS
jgi:hypothetical protein